jgi:hypothetical protein
MFFAFLQTVSEHYGQKLYDLASDRCLSNFALLNTDNLNKVTVNNSESYLLETFNFLATSSYNFSVVFLLQSFLVCWSNRILERHGGMVRTGFIWIRTGTSGWLLWIW